MPLWRFGIFALSACRAVLYRYPEACKTIIASPTYVDFPMPVKEYLLCGAEGKLPSIEFRRQDTKMWNPQQLRQMYYDKYTSPATAALNLTRATDNSEKEVNTVAQDSHRFTYIRNMLKNPKVQQEYSSCAQGVLPSIQLTEKDTKILNPLQMSSPTFVSMRQQQADLAVDTLLAVPPHSSANSFTTKLCELIHSIYFSRKNKIE